MYVSGPPSNGLDMECYLLKHDTSKLLSSTAQTTSPMSSLLQMRSAWVCCFLYSPRIGLNLNIHRIIFSSLYKYTPKSSKVPLSIPLFKQIAGRAGRRNCEWPTGMILVSSSSVLGQVTTLQSADYPLLQRYMKESLAEQKTAVLFPPYQQIYNFAEHVLLCWIDAYSYLVSWLLLSYDSIQL